MTRRSLARTLGLALAAAVVACAAQAAGDKDTPWAALTAAQQQVLAPLQREWPNLDQTRRQKWLEVARRFPAMPADERQRVQARMVEWARLTPAERTQARLQFQEVRQLPPDERNAKWQAYQALPESERRTLALRAQPAGKAASAAAEAASRPRLAATDGIQPKKPQHSTTASTPSRPTTPIVVQARPGATTTTMSARAKAPPSAASGAPKIAATANYVDPATLLPKRGTQEGQTPGSGETAPQQ